jgi:DNA-3-methyladenine glycosylase II
MRPDYWDTATKALARRDPVLRRLRSQYPDISLRRRTDAFTTLARAITGQQISVKAAQTIWNRVLIAAAGKPNRLAAPAIIALDPDALRGCGLSQRKTEYIRDLATKFVDGQIRPRRWHGMDDEAVIAELVAVKGIGRWTAEMFLMFNLLRPDVLPVDDIGLQNAVALHYNDGDRLAISDLRAIAESWTPWRSVATFYLWRSLDPIPVEY